MRQGRRFGWWLGAVVLGCLAAPAAHAVDGYVGVGAGHSTRADHSFVLSELVWSIDSPLRLNLNLEYFRAADVRHFTTSLDVAYYASLRPFAPRLTGWLGVGLGVLTRDPVGPRQAATRDGQFNVIAGLGYEGPVMPFAQLKLAAGRPSYAIGVRFAL